ncbi:MAG TPA: TIGR03086 family metal-binding protein [Pilimelia sp.]|nr:TIGR03086 family metal-binding protein [Pilimelia sp.]
MASELSAHLRAAAAPTVAVVRGIDDRQLDRPTPCGAYTVRDLVNHLWQVVVNFVPLAAKQPADWTTTPDRVHGDWRAAFAASIPPLVEAWGEPSAREGVSPGMGMPQPVVGGLAVLDLAVHGWDLARATGQAYAPDPAVAAAVAELVARLGSRPREMGVFGEEVPVPADAPAWDRLLGRTGRDPAWTAPA